MLENVVDLLKQKSITVPSILFYNVRELGINCEELYFLIYILNSNSLVFDMVKIGKELSMKPKEVLKLVNDLNEKNLLKLDVKKKGNDVTEYINIDGLFRKIAYLSINNKDEVKVEENKPTIYDEFERVFKRPLTPKDFQIITAWRDMGYKEETILLALKEASYNEVYNIPYIDKILNNWDKKGIKTEADVNKYHEEFSRKKEEPIDILEEDYDWLNE